MNTGLVANGKYAILSHGDENLEGNEMGMIAAFDPQGGAARRLDLSVDVNGTDLVAFEFDDPERTALIGC